MVFFGRHLDAAETELAEVLQYAIFHGEAGTPLVRVEGKPAPCGALKRRGGEETRHGRTPG